MALEGHLTHVPLGYARVPLLIEGDLDVVDPIEEAGETGHLVLSSGAKSVREFDVAPADADVHLPRSVEVSGSRRRDSIRAAWTRRAPRSTGAARQSAGACRGRRLRAAPTGRSLAAGRRRR